MQVMVASVVVAVLGGALAASDALANQPAPGSAVATAASTSAFTSAFTAASASIPTSSLTLSDPTVAPHLDAVSLANYSSMPENGSASTGSSVSAVGSSTVGSISAVGVSSAVGSGSTVSSAGDSVSTVASAQLVQDISDTSTLAGVTYPHERLADQLGDVGGALGSNLEHSASTNDDDRERAAYNAAHNAAYSVTEASQSTSSDLNLANAPASAAATLDKPNEEAESPSILAESSLPVYEQILRENARAAELLAQMQHDPALNMLMTATWGLEEGVTTLQVLQHYAYTNFARMQVEDCPDQQCSGQEHHFQICLPVKNRAMVAWIAPALPLYLQNKIREELTQQNIKLHICIGFKVADPKSGAQIVSNHQHVKAGQSFDCPEPHKHNALKVLKQDNLPVTVESFGLTYKGKGVTVPKEEALKWWMRLVESDTIQNYPLQGEAARDFAYVTYKVLTQQAQVAHTALPQFVMRPLLPELSDTSFYTDAELNFIFTPLLNHFITKVDADDKQRILKLQVHSDLYQINEYALGLLFKLDYSFFEPGAMGDHRYSSNRERMMRMFAATKVPILESTDDSYSIDFKQLPSSRTYTLHKILSTNDFSLGYSSKMLDPQKPDFFAQDAQRLSQDFLAIRVTQGELDIINNHDFSQNKKYKEWIEALGRTIPYQEEALIMVNNSFVRSFYNEESDETSDDDVNQRMLHEIQKNFWALLKEHHINDVRAPELTIDKQPQS